MFEKYKRKRAYNKYIKSDEWKAKREEKFNQVGRQCEMWTGQSWQGDVDGCWGYPLHVHHVTYANFGNEKMEDLMVLCGRHHSDKHPHMKCPKDRRPANIEDLIL